MLLAAVACWAGSLTLLQAQEKGNAPAMSDPAQQEMMKKWQEAMTPGAPHQKLAEMEGSWDAEMKMWMGGPDTPPAVNRMTCTMKMVLGGRFLQQEVQGQMMGMPFSGMGFTGYDNVNKHYVGFWIDNMGTGMSTLDGVMNQKGDVLTMYGKMDEPGTGEHGKNIKYVTRLLGRDKQVFEVHDLAIGEPNTKVMEMTYTRKK